MSKGRVDGKVAIVTGATSGIGREAAVMMTREGAHVIATGRNEKEGAETERQIKAAGGDGFFIRQDITDEQGWQDIIATAVDSFGRLDILVNNAGLFFVKPIAETTAEDFDHIFKINVEGTWLGMKYAMGEMEKQKRGSIINVSSLMGLVGFPGATAYCATKGAITLMTKSAAMEGVENENQIRVNSLHPGVVWTKMIEDTMGDSQEVKDFFISETPLKMLGYPEHLAAGILYLASDEAKYVTGADITIDGGRGAD